MVNFEKRGKKWCVVVSVTESGARKKMSKTFNLKREAEAWATEIEASANSGELIFESTMSLEDYFKTWFENYKKADLRESSTKMYQASMMNIHKYLNGITLATLSTVKLQKSLDEFGSTHSLGSTRMLWAHIKASLTDA